MMMKVCLIFLLPYTTAFLCQRSTKSWQRCRESVDDGDDIENIAREEFLVINSRTHKTPLLPTESNLCETMRQVGVVCAWNLLDETSCNRLLDRVYDELQQSIQIHESAESSRFSKLLSPSLRWDLKLRLDEEMKEYLNIVLSRDSPIGSFFHEAVSPEGENSFS